MRSAILDKLYPWLLPAIVTLLLVLSFAGAERVRRNTPEGKFNRIHLGMDHKHAYEILGEPEQRSPIVPGSFRRETWAFDDQWITVDFDEKEQVWCKSFGRLVDGTAVGLFISDRESP